MPVIRALRSERGSVIVLVSACITVLLGVAAFAVDLGYARQRRAQAQSSADFAALAGAGVLKEGSVQQAEDAARTYVTKNGFSGDDAEVNVPPASGSRAGVDGCVQVGTSEQLSTVFGRIFNVGSMTVRAGAVACGSPGAGGPYAVFAGSTTCSPGVSFTGSDRTINGGVHSNSDMKVQSAGTVIKGDVTYLSGEAPSGNITFVPSTGNPHQIPNPLPYPEIFDIDDYAPGGSKAALAQSQFKYRYAGSADIDETWLTLNLLFNPITKAIAPGLYYTTGNIHLNGTGYSAQGATFVTRSGDIHMNGNNFTFTPWDPDGLLLFSNKSETSCSSGQSVVKINGNNHSWTGIMFAPRGPLDFSGTSIVASLNGRLVAQSVNLSGSLQTITRTLSFPGRMEGFELVE